MNTPLRLAVVQGSTRDGRLGPVVAHWMRGHAAARPDMTVDLIDLAETPLPTVFPQLGQGPADEADRALLRAVSPRIADADAFVVVTPEYNHSYPASLKNAIDWHNKEWHAKPVAFVSYGGFSGGLRAVEHLRGVFAELHAVTVREAVGLQGVWAQFDAEGKAVDPAVDAAAKSMLDQLAWWGEALRDARAKQPYAA
ncbi:MULTISPECIES: NADPH-dependent FMN reductase [Streptomyces]|uniref:NAD(P)H-dependent oxidoreductase n=1 Tax=Streptomyces solicathayae TaxID=3081768 RepID=A0ABZ0M4C6_9ACTN|nr:NAD(P)H-dependent oxidoreductase [Streptomyces sp. HUAS YS2]WOX26632.1 NAD(P)H-dependent oxidoreductase [Streptomyces sp. HUAS YS2]